jgi:dihydrolipoamide dehydrogenase
MMERIAMGSTLRVVVVPTSARDETITPVHEWRSSALFPDPGIFGRRHPCNYFIVYCSSRRRFAPSVGDGNSGFSLSLRHFSQLMASFDVIFLGGGPAGYVGAIRCAQLGFSVGVVEKEGLGGTCVLWGCIPAKALLESAAIANRVKHAAEFGVNLGDVKTDYNVAMKRSRGVSSQNSKGVEFLFKKNKITWIKGTAKLAGKNSVSVKSGDGKDEKHDAKKAVIVATGSRVKGLPQVGLELNKTTIISSDEALILEKAPKSIIIVGAGAVGCEFADVFNAFGSEVTLIDIAPTILPLEDADAAKEVEKSFKKRGITVLTGAKISNVKATKDSVSMSVDAGGE